MIFLPSKVDQKQIVKMLIWRVKSDLLRGYSSFSFSECFVYFSLYIHFHLINLIFLNWKLNFQSNDIHIVFLFKINQNEILLFLKIHFLFFQFLFVNFKFFNFFLIFITFIKFPLFWMFFYKLIQNFIFLQISHNFFTINNFFIFFLFFSIFFYFL